MNILKWDGYFEDQQHTLKHIDEVKSQTICYASLLNLTKAAFNMHFPHNANLGVLLYSSFISRTI